MICILSVGYQYTILRMLQIPKQKKKRNNIVCRSDTICIVYIPKSRTNMGNKLANINGLPQWMNANQVSGYYNQASALAFIRLCKQFMLISNESQKQIKDEKRKPPPWFQFQYSQSYMGSIRIDDSEAYIYCSLASGSNIIRVLFSHFIFLFLYNLFDCWTWNTFLSCSYHRLWKFQMCGNDVCRRPYCSCIFIYSFCCCWKWKKNKNRDSLLSCILFFTAS